MDKTSEAILFLKPVTFRYKKDLDLEGIPQFGLVAEEVGKVNPDLVARDEQEHKAFVAEQRKVQEQGATITQLKAELQATATRQQKQIEALTAGHQKASDQLELSKAAQRTVLNDQ